MGITPQTWKSLSLSVCLSFNGSIVGCAQHGDSVMHVRVFEMDAAAQFRHPGWTYDLVVRVHVFQEKESPVCHRSLLLLQGAPLGSPVLTRCP